MSTPEPPDPSTGAQMRVARKTGTRRHPKHPTRKVATSTKVYHCPGCDRRIKGPTFRPVLRVMRQCDACGAPYRLHGDLVRASWSGGGALVAAVIALGVAVYVIAREGPSVEALLAMFGLMLGAYTGGALVGWLVGAGVNAVLPEGAPPEAR